MEADRVWSVARVRSYFAGRVYVLYQFVFLYARRNIFVPLTETKTSPKSIHSFVKIFFQTRIPPTKANTIFCLAKPFSISVHN